MGTDKVAIKDLINIILKYKKAIVATVFLTAAFSVQLTFWMEKKYKADFEINVYSKYFKNPLISEIIPGVYQIPEMRFTIDSMIKEAISDDYIDSVAFEYGIYSKDLVERELAVQRQFLRDRFSYFSTGGQSYKISFIHTDPFIAKKVVEKTLDLVKGHFIKTRIDTIEMVKEIMVKRLQSFNAAQNISKSDSSNALASKNPDVLKSELEKLNSNIAALTKQFNQNHPKVVSLKSRRSVIKNWLSEFENKGSGFISSDTQLAFTSDKNTVEQLSAKFYTKYHDFTIALEVEKRSLESYIGITKQPSLPISPISPKKRLFAAIGLILGVLFAFIFVFFNEVMAPNREEQLLAEAEEYGALVLGVLPLIKNEVVSGAVAQVEDNKEARVH
ncbi:MAG: LPS O-antigen subunit length determinant protein (WzzB/FepE family) [Bacteriovoracaceae bacterium]|jgi:LPS O-antigen subunit length determinant protein (WzzB/FepE family)